MCKKALTLSQEKKLRNNNEMFTKVLLVELAT